MPELPEVEVVARALDAALRGRELERAVFIGKCRLPFDAAATNAALGGKTVAGVRRRAKYLLIDFNAPSGLLAHLGMTGNFRIVRRGAPRQKHDRLAFILRGGDELRYADARRFGFVRLARMDGRERIPEELSRLGPEPLERAFTAKAMLERARKRKTPIKTFIMDQSVVVGVGNIYANEALFAAGVHPGRPAGTVAQEEWTRLAAGIKSVLRRAVKKGGSTIRDYAGVDGKEGAFQRSLNVYGRAGAPCPRCGAAIAAARHGGRSTFFCPECQT